MDKGHSESIRRQQKPFWSITSARLHTGACSQCQISDVWSSVILWSWWRLAVLWSCYWSSSSRWEWCINCSMHVNDWSCFIIWSFHNCPDVIIAGCGFVLRWKKFEILRREIVLSNPRTITSLAWVTRRAGMKTMMLLANGKGKLLKDSQPGAAHIVAPSLRQFPSFCTNIIIAPQTTQSESETFFISSLDVLPSGSSFDSWEWWKILARKYYLFFRKA